jgi:hypothetical protein
MSKAFHAQSTFRQAFFNDQTLIGKATCSQQAEHDDQIYVEIKPSPRS